MLFWEHASRKQKLLYTLGVAVVFLSVYSQYFLALGAVGGYLVVYGIPIVVVTLFFGKTILPKAVKNNSAGFKYGLGLFGALTLLGFFLSFVVLSIILQFDTNALNLLTKPNPVLDVSPSQAWMLMAISLFIVGPAEEYLFRGFIYGGLLKISKGKHWLTLAIMSSFMFAVVHAYYLVTYQIASIIPFINLTVFGLAMAIAYYWSGGNILALAVIHGLYDVTGFLGIATTNAIGLLARFIFVAIGIIFALVFLVKKVRINSETGSQTEAKKPAVDF